MTGWLTALRDRPIAETERTGAMATVTVLMLTAAILLVFYRPHDQPQQSSSPTFARTPGSEHSKTRLTSDAAGAADIFLAGYLDYLYGHALASRIKNATPALLRALRTNPPRVSPAMRGREPRIVALNITPSPSGQLVVSATINDGGLIDYAIRFLLIPRGGHLVVNALRGDE